MNIIPSEMKARRYYWILALIFLFTLGLRLFYAFQADGFSSDTAYYTLRQVESIRDTGLPILSDNLSYGGRAALSPPLFYYILALSNLFLPLGIAAKLIPNLLASTVVFITYLISYELTKSKKAAVFTSFVSAFIPIFFIETINSVSVYSLVIPLMFISIYCLMRIHEHRRYAFLFTVSVIALAFTHASSIVFAISLAFYTLLVKSENLKQDRAELEAIIFSIFFITWVQFLIFKKAFLMHGISVIWQNIPLQLLSQHFTDITLPLAIYEIGTLPFLYGIYAISHYIFREKDRNMYLLAGFVIPVAGLLWLKLIPVRAGLVFLGVILILLFAREIQLFLEYMRRTRFSGFENFSLIMIAAAFILTSFLPTISLAGDTVSSAYGSEYAEASLWLMENTDSDDVVLASLKEGSIINYYAKRKNVIDSNFLLVKNINQRFRDVNTMYKTPYETEAIGLLNKYGVSYILFSPRTAAEYRIDGLGYASNKECFALVYDREIKIYRSMCRLEER